MAEGFVNFLNEASGSPFFASNVIQKRLEEKGYVHLKENEMWSLEKNKKYYLVRDNTSIIAFRTNNSSSASPFVISCTHLDSPSLKLKPNPEMESEGLKLITCECYGGGIWNTWVDRDLGISGRVILKSGESKAFSVKEPLMRICSLAIHLDDERKHLINKETHLRAVCADCKDKSVNAYERILEIIAKHLNIDKEEIEASDIYLCSTQPASFISNGKYIAGQGIDNLNGVYTALEAFFNVEKNTNDKEQIDVFVAFDNEEIGSMNRRGAESVFLKTILERIHSTLFDDNKQSIYVSFANSIALSIDGSHADHPTIDLMEKQHHVKLNGGPVLKQNVSQKYMSDGFLRLLIKKSSGVKTQIFVLRQDLTGGSTVGPHIASTTGIVTIDMGNPMLSMHSIREICGSNDVESMIKLIEGCYNTIPKVSI